MYPYKIVVLLLAVLKLNCICLGDVVTAKSVWKQHNRYRKMKGMPKLSLSKKLCKDCEDYAKHLATLNVPDQSLFEDLPDPFEYIEFSLDEADIKDHTDYILSDEKNIDYTENICEFKSKSCVETWYTYGHEAYKSDDESRKSLSDKYTALIWKSSKEMGVGIAPKNSGTKNGRKIMVVRYSPPGNVRGKYKENVPAHEELLWDFEVDVNTTTTSKACGTKSYTFAVLLSFQTLTHWFP
ncbi:Golgi-associated plant pathogenesis-related protein 1-like [Drosophila subpulchrella]|uniref:Golgi-associated plant pathogenesis-related protein 1-like n=1 Tax=Drosophila subpulchrella TaxID=1486046 RepID=UPI0018A1A7C2|nr:Golgi-associated plant pathogenesis-related protein 1-like [Drosophila subpulchrella]